ncbi:TPA: hypothetical protein I7185_13835 [Vibrio vulnificus]|nr:hypothetical protein [Vibrio vulnificus]
MQQVVWLGITASLPVLLLGCSMLLPIAVSAFSNAASGGCGCMVSRVHGNDSCGRGGVLSV